MYYDKVSKWIYRQGEIDKTADGHQWVFNECSEEILHHEVVLNLTLNKKCVLAQ